MQRAENKIETRFKLDLKEWARSQGLLIQCLKLSVSGFNGWPDRLIVWEGGNAAFFEFKDKDGEYQPLQPYVLAMIDAMGFTVEVHDDSAVALESIKGKVHASLGTSEGHVADRKKQRVPLVLATGEGKNGNCFEGVLRVKGAGPHRCTTRYCAPEGDYDVLAVPAGEMGRLLASFLRDNPRGQDRTAEGDGRAGRRLPYERGGPTVK